LRLPDDVVGLHAAARLAPVRRACARLANRPKLHKRRGSGSFVKNMSIYEEKVDEVRGRQLFS